MKLKIDLDIADTMRDDVHGFHDKSLIVLHETVSPNYKGLSDIWAVSRFLDQEGYGIHGITDNDGNKAWALGLGKAIFYHAQSGSGNVNTRGIGIEQVSDVMMKYKTRKDQIAAWAHMKPELNATAKLMACIARAHNIPLVSSNGTKPGVVTHWEVSHTYHIAGGHTDCWPVHLGGYYPKLEVISLAKRYYKLGWRF